MSNNPIIKILNELNIDEAKIKELFKTLTENPFMAMGVIQKMGIPQEKLQQIMGIVMSTPSIIKEAVEELGLDFSAVEKAKEAMKDKIQK
jgi:hypothetical protein